MKKVTVSLVLLVISFMSLVVDAEEFNRDDLEKVTISMLQPKVVAALKEHYGGFTQFKDLELVEVVPRQVPADLKDDSSFKASGSVYDLTVELTAIFGEAQEDVTIILSNEFSNGEFDVVSFQANKK